MGKTPKLNKTDGTITLFTCKEQLPKYLYSNITARMRVIKSWVVF